MRYGIRVLASFGLVVAAPAQAEQIFSLETKQFTGGEVLTKATPMPGGGKVVPTLTSAIVFQSQDWKKYPYKQLIVSGLTDYPLQEIAFESKFFDSATNKSILSIFEGEFPVASTRMFFVLSCGNASLASFHAQSGKLTLSQYGKPDVTWGTYKRANVDAKGKEQLLIHSVFMLVDLKNKTFRITFMEDGQTMTTGTRPWSNPTIDIGPSAMCKLEAGFDKPAKSNRYIIANVGISANK